MRARSTLDWSQSKIFLVLFFVIFINIVHYSMFTVLDRGFHSQICSLYCNSSVTKPQVQLQRVSVKITQYYVLPLNIFLPHEQPQYPVIYHA